MRTYITFELAQVPVAVWIQQHITANFSCFWNIPLQKYVQNQ